MPKVVTALIEAIVDKQLKAQLGNILLGRSNFIETVENPEDGLAEDGLAVMKLVKKACDGNAEGKLTGDTLRVVPKAPLKNGQLHYEHNTTSRHALLSP